MKQKAYALVHENKFFIKFIYGLIILNVLALIFESYEEAGNAYKEFFDVFEILSVIIFSIEYLIRFWTADLNPEFNGTPNGKRFKFTFSWLGMIDLLAILPFYLPLLFPFDLRVIRILRLFRLLRIFKLGRYSQSIKTINDVLEETKEELAITAFIAAVLLVLSASLMYYIEHDQQPEDFASIGHALWWAVATLTTVGYGDVYPMTSMGKFLSGIIALIGIGFVALPTGIISSAFIERVQEQQKERRGKKTCTCPNCGTEVNCE